MCICVCRKGVNKSPLKDLKKLHWCGFCYEFKQNIANRIQQNCHTLVCLIGLFFVYINLDVIDQNKKTSVHMLLKGFAIQWCRLLLCIMFVFRSLFCTQLRP